MTPVVHTSPHRPLTFVWLGLVAATLLTWSLGERGASGPLAAAVLLAVIVLKGHAIAEHFMELRHAPALWRWTTSGWLFLTTSLIALAYWKGMA